MTKTAISQMRLLALLGIFAVCAFSQTAQVTGTVTDQTGSVLTGALIEARNVDTGVTRASTSNEVGNYLVTALLPGNYQVTAQAPGFRQVVREFRLAVDQIGRVDFTMQVGETKESITVEGSAVLLDVATSTVGTVVENTQVSELPLAGRNPLELLALSTGIRVQGGFGGKNGAWGNFSSNGGLANANSVMVEGLALDMAQMNSPSFVPPVDATEEFRVQTNKFSAEFGRTAGAIVNFSIKSGTNDIHGSAYEFLRNDALNANNFFFNRGGVPKSPLRQNQFGASVGGPIKKDRTFFFFNWEDYYERSRSATASLTTVPTPLQRAGDFSQTFNSAGNLLRIADPLTTTLQADGSYARTPFADNRIPVGRFSRVAANVVQIWPQANAQGNAVTNVNNFATVGATGLTEHQIVTKLDHNVNDTWKVFGTYSGIWAGRTSSDTLGYKVNLTRDSSYKRNHATVSATAVFSPTLIGEFRSGFARYHSPSIPFALGFDITTLGLPQALADQTQIQSFPAFNVAGLVSVGSSASAGLGLVDLNSWGQRASMTWVKSAHTVKFGTDFRIQQLNQFQSNSLQPAFQFSSQMSALDPTKPTLSGVPLASFLMGYMASASVAKSERLANQRKYWSMFIQDDWKVTRKLTMNLGLDYSLEFPITERYNADEVVARLESHHAGNAATGVAGHEQVVFALGRVGVAHQAAFGADAGKLRVPAGDQLMRVDLMAGIPDQPIAAEVE